MQLKSQNLNENVPFKWVSRVGDCSLTFQALIFVSIVEIECATAYEVYGLFNISSVQRNV